LIEGLSVTGRLAYSSVEENSRQVFRSSFPTYHYSSENDSYNIDPRGNYAYGTYAVLGNLNVSTKNLNLQAFLNYDKSFNDDHNFNFLFLYNRQSSGAQANVPANFEGYTAKINYNYKEKFLLDLNAAYNGTDRFGKDNRFGLFPAIGAGYNISKEDFFHNSFPFIDLLKIKGSYGVVGSDITFGNRYLYQQVYQSGGGYPFGESQTTYPTVYEGSLGNPNVTWEKARKFNIGLDGNMFEDKLSFDINYFYDYRFDQLVTREDVPQILGIGISPNNIAETSNQGFDGQIGYQNTYGELQFNTNLVFSYARNKVLFKAEAQQAYPWLTETGQQIGQPFGYTNIGFYSEDDIASLNDGNADNDAAVPLSDVPVQAGDLKYKDLNEDGVINNFDQSPIGKPNLPTTTLGWTLGFNYKGFSARVLFQGAFDYSFSVIGTGIEPFKSQFQPLHLQRWTPQTAETAEFPRLTSNPSTINSSAAYMSDFWLVDAWYVRLKSVDISYQLPDNWIPFDINNVRLYVNAYNLFTVTSYVKYQQDPEISTNTAGDSYFNQKVVNLGLQVGF
jgi:TonB-linked SusC/RagA family outer membrane protein